MFFYICGTLPSDPPNLIQKVIVNMFHQVPSPTSHSVNTSLFMALYNQVHKVLSVQDGCVEIMHGMGSYWKK
jgi:hypothetical protein